MTPRVFVDFDGTITADDVGNSLFRTFGGSICDSFVHEYRQERLSAVECFRGEAAAVGQVKKSSLELFLRSQVIDSSFSGFVQFCSDRNIPLAILSDGLDYYIREILTRNGIECVDIYANCATLVPTGDGETIRLDVRFPHTNAECPRCACCKRNLLLTLSAEDDVIVYVGEGFSDTCPARYADIVFAKHRLQQFCQDENISYLPYETFSDVQATIGLRMQQGSIRKRFRAELQRREAYIAE
jgi:2,3-diketo-5-methylthio-1-phosphopentane phosphatase